MAFNVALIQAPLQWHNAAANRTYFESKIAAARNCNLWVLPEMFTSGFTNQAAAVAETMDGSSVAWMKEQAIAKATNICGSMVISEKGKFFNRLILAKKDGSINFYDKRHLFTMAGEHHQYTAGHSTLICEIDRWKVAFLVCYDLRFPAFARNSNENRYDLMVYVANWPMPRIGAWDKLLLARAIENQSYVIGVNRIGEDDNGLVYNGHSACIDPFGEYIIAPHSNETVEYAELELEQLEAFRQKFPVLNDRDNYSIIA